MHTATYFKVKYASTQKLVSKGHRPTLYSDCSNPMSAQDLLPNHHSASISPAQMMGYPRSH